MAKNLKTIILIILAAAVLGLPLGWMLSRPLGHLTYAHGLKYYGPTEKLIYPK